RQGRRSPRRLRRGSSRGSAGPARLGGAVRRRRDREPQRTVHARHLGSRAAGESGRESGRAHRRRIVSPRDRRGVALTSLADTLLELELEVDGVELERRELALSPEFRRVTTTVHLRGRGVEGLGEDVSYQPDLHDAFPVPAVVGRWRLASFSESLEGFDFFESAPEGAVQDGAAYDYRRWAWESAALDLALSQAASTLGEVGNRVQRPVRYVV